jgi:hypothetical protein
MSKIEVDAIEPQSGTTLTIGASGDTITIPAGAILTGSGASLAWQSVQTTGFTASAGNAYPCNTTSAGFTVTLPATPSAGDQVQLVDYAGTFDTNALVIDPNGEDIEGATGNQALTGEREGVILTYIDSTQGWIATSGINEGTDALFPATFTTDFLVIAGGGGGAGSIAASIGQGGGGAGGYRTSAGTSGGGASAESQLTLNINTNYTVTVGAGGNGGTSANGTKGSNSVFSTITSEGGGLGSSGAGGSGGGGRFNNVAGGAGTANQGFKGGDGVSGHETGAGGGGAGAVGLNTATPFGLGGAGGVGVASSITGSSITRAGGGGGGSSIDGGSAAGGTGGGGAGGSQANGTAGTVNTGGGGGGGGRPVSGSTTGGAGGSGIVIIKYPDIYTISNPGGGLTSSTATAGGFKVTSFTAGTGTIQFN